MRAAGVGVLADHQHAGAGAGGGVQPAQVVAGHVLAQPDQVGAALEHPLVGAHLPAPHARRQATAAQHPRQHGHLRGRAVHGGHPEQVGQALAVQPHRAGGHHAAALHGHRQLAAGGLAGQQPRDVDDDVLVPDPVAHPHRHGEPAAVGEVEHDRAARAAGAPARARAGG